jgi:radical SAM protein with 4Fe4S-binding SPASM domain
MRFSFLGDNIDSKILLLLKKYNLMHLHSKVHPFQRIESPIEYNEPEKSNFLTGKIYCSKGFYKKQMVVPGGDVVMCCMDVEKKHVLGNLETHSYKEIYSGNEYKRVLHGFNDEKEDTICRKCVYAKKIPAKICLSYSADSNYLKFLTTSISSLNNTSPDIYAHIDIINTEDCQLFDRFKNVLIKNTTVNELRDQNYSIVKNINCEILQERSVKLTGAYANLRKVYNIYSLLVDYNFDYVINMDADNIITRDLALFFNNLDTKADLLLKYASREKLVGEKLERRYFNFKDFDVNKIDLDNLDVHFREGCLVVRNTEMSREFFKYISENILSKIAWYGDSYWITRAYLNFKDKLKIVELPNDFVNYNINDTSVEPYVVSGYGTNKHSSKYATITKKYG